jgi:hypothetical protein
MDWFKGKVTEKTYRKYGKINGFPMVSNEDFPLNPSIEG